MGVPPRRRELSFQFPASEYLHYNLNCSIHSLSLTLQIFLQAGFAASCSQ